MAALAAPKNLPTANSYLWRVNLIRFFLPVLLFVVVAVYETEEHWLATGHFEFDLVGEILFFGILGPLAVFFSLTYIVSLLKQLIKAREETEALNRNLEGLVEERTATLEIRNLELAQANAKLQQLDQMKSDFVSLVSHELRAPLTNLNGALELALQNAPQIPPQTQRILVLMAEESQRLTRFVQNLLNVSQFEAGKLALNPGPVAVMPLLTRAVATVLPDTQRPIHWQAPSDLSPLWADEVYLEEIIRNLLLNADKYTPPQSPIDLTVLADNHCLKIMITDYGLGIPAAFHEKIFDRFYRQERGDQISSQGWGLGLYFARVLTEAQGGCLTLTSPVHDNTQMPGARFTLTLPLTEEVPDDA